MRASFATHINFIKRMSRNIAEWEFSGHGHVSCAAPTTKHPPPQAVIALQFTPEYGTEKAGASAQIVYVPVAPTSHWASPPLVTDTAFVGAFW
jgi:hypothetical protein